MSSLTSALVVNSPLSWLGRAAIESSAVAGKMLAPTEGSKVNPGPAVPSKVSERLSSLGVLPVSLLPLLSVMPKLDWLG